MNDDNQQTMNAKNQKEQSVPEDKDSKDSPGYDEGVDIGVDVTGKALEVLHEESKAGLKPPGKPPSPRNPPHSGTND